MLGVVYKLRCLDLSIKEFYVGSSMNIKERIKTHKSGCNNTNNKSYTYKVYKFIRDNGGYDAWTYDILLEVDVEDKDDLRLNYERKYILELNPQLNSQIEGRTVKEWEKANKELVVTRKKKYREKNKEKIAEKLQCECGSIISRGGKARHEKTNKHIDFLNNKKN